MAAVGIGVIGFGHWGPNHARVFSQTEGAALIACADRSARRRDAARRLFPGIEVADSAAAVLAHPGVSAVVVATPTSTHFDLALAGLRAGKHVLVEKPLCDSVARADQLVAEAARQGLVLAVGNVFVHNASVRYLRDRLRDGTFGRLYYLHATRTNLGPIRTDVNAIYDLASHDLSIFNFLLGRPQWVAAVAHAVLQPGKQDLAFVTVGYEQNVLAHVHVSWLNPRKVRQLTIVGERRMAFWNDMDTSEPVRLYDKGLMEEPYYDSFGEFQMRLRDADVLIPKINQVEPLKAQAARFIARIRTGEPMDSEGAEGLDVVRCLEAIDRSLAHGGSQEAVRG